MVIAPFALLKLTRFLHTNHCNNNNNNNSYNQHGHSSPKCYNIPVSFVYGWCCNCGKSENYYDYYRRVKQSWRYRKRPSNTRQETKRDPSETDISYHNRNSFNPTEQIEGHVIPDSMMILLASSLSTLSSTNGIEVMTSTIPNSSSSNLHTFVPLLSLEDNECDENHV
jgi:hypothetical protein